MFMKYLSSKLYIEVSILSSRQLLGWSQIQNQITFFQEALKSHGALKLLLAQGAEISLWLLEVMPAQQGLLQDKPCHWDQLAQLQWTPATIQRGWGARWKAILLCQPGMGKARVQCSHLPKLQIAFHQGMSLAAPRCLHIFLVENCTGGLSLCLEGRRVAVFSRCSSLWRWL